MRKQPLVLFCACAIASPALAQGVPDGTPDHHGSSPGSDKRAPPQQATDIAFWPAEVQAYYRSLPSPRQDAFRLLTDDYRIRLTGMDEAQRAAAWQEIERKLQERSDAMAQQEEQPESEPQ